MIELLLKLEMSLWINETRNNELYMSNILHPDFKEIGQSGNVYTKNDILSDLSNNIVPKFPLKNPNLKQLSDGVFLVSYEINYTVNDIEYNSIRTSIWLSNEDAFVLYHHQGTLVK